MASRALFAEARVGIFVNQEFVGLDRGIEVFGLKLLAHSPIEIADGLDRRRNLRPRSA